METLHPREIALGLERVREVQARLQLVQPRFAIVTVAGTNGKGSTVAMLEAVLRAAGYRVGAYTSPHLIDYNERVRIDAQPATDAALCEAFARVEAARGATELTYFEFGTLAAVDLFARARIDIAVLEVGLGGRLDAVNAWDPDVAIVTSVGIDHTDWLGPDRESIGREKAGIFRAGRPAICADPQPPQAIAQAAAAIGADLFQLGRDFSLAIEGVGWSWRAQCGCGADIAPRLRAGLPHPAMRGDYQLLNAAAALMALECLAPRVPVTQAHVRAGLLGAVLPGRFQTLPGQPVRVLDVAHNAQAAQALARTLAAQPVAGRTLAVAGMLKDKPIADVLSVLTPHVDEWFLASLSGSRGASAEQLHAALALSGTRAPTHIHSDVPAAYAAAREHAVSADRIVVFGSFYTVGAILRSARAA